MNLCSYWRAVLAQDADGMRAFLAPDAVVRWPNTRERFTAEEFIRVNCAYPGAWKGGLERVEYAGDVAICVVLVQSADDAQSLHAVSFLRLHGDRIVQIDEYWSDDGPVPPWRTKLLAGGLLQSSQSDLGCEQTRDARSSAQNADACEERYPGGTIERTFL